MQVNKRTMFFLIPSLLVFLLSGCPLPQRSAEVVSLSDFTEGHSSSSVAKRFQESAPQGPTAVESAIELAKKHAELSEEMVVLRQKNQGLIAENSRFKERLVTLEPKLQQTQKELAEANDLLIEMRIELNNWKMDILGFRAEMRDAEKTQLEALLKILNVLGGEVKPESAGQMRTVSSAADSSELSRPQLQESLTSGKSNE
ncbi:MAG TPA: hypothetical protein ENH34_05795 [Phycisphaerales bacterium]|nr:hypothetical protein [Phycisphaerales bacterium]